MNHDRLALEDDAGLVWVPTCFFVFQSRCLVATNAAQNRHVLEAVGRMISYARSLEVVDLWLYALAQTLPCAYSQ